MAFAGDISMNRKEREARRSEYPTVKCTECGKISEAHYFEETKRRMVDLSLCFECLHWTDLINVKNESRVARIDGNHYMVESDKPKAEPGFLKGFGGTRFEIKFHDGRQVVTHNLWHQGSIPQHFRERLPNNAEFVREIHGTSYTNTRQEL